MAPPTGWLRRLGLEPRRLSSLERIVLTCGLVYAAICFGLTVRDNRRYSGVDLRDKVVGARALTLGMDPYRYVWHPGMSEELLDPLCGYPGLTRVTVPPTTLCFYATVAWLPYRVQRVLWFLLEWAALLASIALLTRCLKAHRSRVFFLFLALFFFIGGPFWRLHVERGQHYVFTLLALSLAVRALSGGRRGGVWPGVWFGVAAALRPTFALMLLPAAFLGRWKTAGATLATLLGIVLITLPIGGLRAWRSYFDTMRNYELIWSGVTKGEDLVGRAQPTPASAEGIVPSEMDSFTTNLTLIGFQAKLEKNLPFWRGVIRPQWLPWMNRAAVAGLVIAACALLFAAKRAKLSVRYAVALGLLLCMAVDVFAPIRYGYADVLFLAPLALLTPLMVGASRPWAAVAVVLGFMMGQSFIFNIGGAGASYSRFGLVMAGLGGCLLVPLLPRRTPS